jgi:hypothetical protein
MLYHTLSYIHTNTTIVVIIIVSTLIRRQILDYNGNTPLHDAVKTFNTDGIVKLFGYKYDYGDDDDDDSDDGDDDDDDDEYDGDDDVMMMRRISMSTIMI